MGMSILSKLVRNVRTTIIKNGPEILVGVGIAGMITTTILAVRATPKALVLIDDKKNEKDVDKLTAIETIKAAWPCYIPAAVTGVMSVVCLIGASSANFKRNAALTAAYTISESALKEYQQKTIETVGEKKEQVIRDAVAKDRLKQNPVEDKEIIITNNGEVLCYDVISGRYFKSDMDSLNRAVNELNRELLTSMQVSLNDFYYEIGLTSITIGNDLGWDVNDGLIELSFSSQLTDHGAPCLVINYRVAPMYLSHRGRNIR